MRMKRIISFLSIPVLALAASCTPELEIQFAHEKQAFETRSNMILLECIMPQASAQDEEIYIIGDFNGGEAAIGNPDYLMTHSDVITSKWGVYLDPSRFQGGKTLADGFTFYSVQQGLERSPKNEDVLHKLSIGAGEWANVYVDKWAKYFAPPENPDEIVLPELEGYGFFVDNSEAPSYAEMALYAWGTGLSDADDLFGSWPGMQPTGTWEYNGVTYTYFDLGSKTNGLTVNFIINNNNAGSQLENFDVFKNQVIDHDFFFKITDDDVAALESPFGGGGGGGDTPEPPVEQPKDPVKVYVQDLTGWEAINLYMWGDKELCGGWPGIAPAEATVKIGTVSYKVFTVEDALGRSENLIFNGEGGQTPDVPLTLEAETFIRLEVVEDKLVATVTNPRNPDIKILVNNKTDWEAISLYAYGDAEAFGGWPGAAPVAYEEVKGVNYTVFGLPADMAGKTLNLIFNNNGGGKQLADFAITVPEKELFLNINANYYVDNVQGNPRGDDSYVYVIDGMGWGESLHMYAWGASEIFGGWPGAAGEPAGTFCGVPAYRFFVAAEHSGKEENLIFNNGNGGDGNQFDGPKVNVGENLYYSIASDFTWTAADLAVRVYVEDNTGWDALYLYSWGTGEIFGGWPGAAVTGVQEIGGKTWKYAEIPASCFGWDANLIFNNNAGTQLENFDVLKGQKVGRDFFFTLTGDGVTVAE